MRAEAGVSAQGPPPHAGSQSGGSGSRRFGPGGPAQGSGSWPTPPPAWPQVPATASGSGSRSGAAPPGVWAGLPPTGSGSRPGSAPGSAPAGSGSAQFRAARAAAALLGERFELGEELGRGAMGVVFRARDRHTGGLVALKVLLDQGSQRRQERFRREGLIAGNLDHPGIVRALDAGETGGVVWLACELVEGGRSLHEDWQREDPQDARLRRVAQVRDAARALGHAHGRGVVHRDVKPGNVLLDREGGVRVTDFGLAAARGLERMTRTGAMVGTPQYMAPEQVAAERGEPSPATDVWALGVMLYQALSGELPFPGHDLVELAVQICERDPRPLRELDPTIDPALEAICHKALQRDQARRYRSGEALAQDLDQALRGGPVSASAPGGPRVAPRAATARRALPLLGAALLVVLAAAGWLSTRSPDAADPVGPAGGAPAGPLLILDPLPAQVSAESLELSGSATPGARVEVRAGTQVLTARVGRDGRWSLGLLLQPGANQLQLELVAGQARHHHQRHTVTRVTTPGWYSELLPARRPPLPLAAGLSFGPRPGEYLHDKDGSLLVWVPPGQARLGSDDSVLVSQPVRVVDFPQGFFLGKHEVSWGQLWRYCAEVGREPPPHSLRGTTHGFEGLLSEAPKDRLTTTIAKAEHPAFGVSWYLARDYCQWAGLRLPSSEEWEYGARGLDGRIYPWGEEERLDRYNGDTDRDGYLHVSPVGAFPEGASPWGCLDMIGNVWEWTATEVPAPNGDGTKRVIRGGAWNCVPFICRATHADMRSPEQDFREQGFRVAR